MRYVIETMGTVASIDLPDDRAEHREPIEAILREIDETFSLYRPDSELSRIARATLCLADSSAALRASYARGTDWRNATSGLFTTHRPDGVLDLNGIVKAEAIERVGEYLDSTGCRRWAINVGGDILVRSVTEPWITGIVDPGNAAALLGSVPLGVRRRAIATSGSAERGEHIWREGESGPAHFAQVSVVADDIVTADVLATAIVAGGPGALDDLSRRWDIDVLTVARDGSLLATPGLRQPVDPVRPSR